MEHTNGFESDPNEYDNEYNDDGPEEFREEVPEITPKEKFLAVYRMILGLHERSGDTYATLIGQVAPFDRELADHLRQCQATDERLIAHCQRKSEGK